MEQKWIIMIAVVIFSVLNFLFYNRLNVHYKEEFGNMMWKLGGVKVYFWQASILASTAGTATILFILKWFNILSF